MRKSVRILTFHLRARVDSIDDKFEQYAIKEVKWLDKELQSEWERLPKDIQHDISRVYYWEDISNLNKLYAYSSLRRIVLEDSIGLAWRMADAGYGVRALQIANVADNRVIDKSKIDLNTINDVLFKITSAYVDSLPYEVDGIILCDVDWINEDEYRPKAAVAYKQNQSAGITKIIGFDWGTPSANGKFTPVALLEPIQLAGTTVKRVTCNNITWIEKMGIEIGKTVKVLKSGEIIPKIIEVLD